MAGGVTRHEQHVLPIQCDRFGGSAGLRPDDRQVIDGDSEVRIADERESVIVLGFEKTALRLSDRAQVV